ncbi:hypothetical protein EN836_18170 [Mesorhizobium sp. M1C.F.Ca.ET.193.01.1.1]|uniref:HEAT repeat domain-containing protein n=1 Tax=unclassified Mesorhizobium TaxID=325217 RepID=UPI000FD2A067|nr:MULTISPECIES: HEAT repeat domain-containing protein [unclassified Mesorhizobium]TGS98183.1 hypothetical protein EN820_36900 [bacterium M00.F.Ca.ET.177.01.1.1]TGQ52714.1 hypothetical protein EN853_18365 [Mesorhizobium sp. M1C.F.Ca.ET.210.01.1.1]TGQ69963.1 hypothetical protein EN855_018175 [Mesorhizobium sp. M1C.F.Ca.ET.212.01.1.1]TGR05582.1 hypothetical protein EN847_18370 [Mesorhizobium sp. M1C.F.Ca.ET.204.01.1.1]TGR26199.1 hypothetical protein EN839_18170 [Mesorhizobium sp. M1C.F.Ca.ET.196
MSGNSSHSWQSEKRPAIPEIVRGHIENGASLWVQYQELREALPEDDTIVQHAWRRLSANLRGAELSGDLGWELSLAQAEDFPEAGEFFILTWLALVVSDRQRLGKVIDLVAENPESIVGVNGAVTLAPVKWLSPFVQGWLESPQWPARVAALAACARHGQDLGSRLPVLLSDRHPEVRMHAVRLLARTGAFEPQLLAELKIDKNPNVRLEAALLLAESGDREGALEVLKALVEDPKTADAVAQRALDRAATLADDDEIKDWVRTMLAKGELDAQAIRVVGIHGDAASWPWLISQMEKGATAEIAGFAACDMLGCELTIGTFFTDDPMRVSDEVAAQYDVDFAILPDVQQFRIALATERLSPLLGEERSLRARTLDRYRAEARSATA